MARSGAQELRDDTPVQLELQAVDTVSPTKIVVTILKEYEAFRRPGKNCTDKTVSRTVRQ